MSDPDGLERRIGAAKTRSHDAATSPMAVGVDLVKRSSKRSSEREQLKRRQLQYGTVFALLPPVRTARSKIFGSQSDLASKTLTLRERLKRKLRIALERVR